MKAVIVDQVTAAAMVDLKGETHLAYRLVAARMREKLANLRQRLETNLDPQETANLRGQIEAIKLALSMPTRLLDEYTTKAGGD